MTDNPIQNFGLTYEAFGQLRDGLINGDESLFERVFVKQFEESRRFLMRECSASADDAYDILCDTIVDFRKKLMERKVDYGNLRFLFTKMAKDNYLKMREKKARTPVSELVLSEADREDDDAPEFDDDQLKALESAWAKLADDCRALLRQHVYDGWQLKQIAQTLSEAEANVRKRKERCMSRLKTYFFELYIP